VAAGDEGLDVINITDPNLPVRAGGSLRKVLLNVCLVRQLCLYAEGSYGFELFNISNPSSPVWMAAYETGLTPRMWLFPVNMPM